MKKIWADEAWDEYLYWQTQDKRTLKKINKSSQCSLFHVKVIMKISD